MKHWIMILPCDYKGAKLNDDTGILGYWYRYPYDILWVNRDNDDKLVN